MCIHICEIINPNFPFMLWHCNINSQDNRNPFQFFLWVTLESFLQCLIRHRVLCESNCCKTTEVNGTSAIVLVTTCFADFIWALYTQGHSLDWDCPNTQFPKCLSYINDLEHWNSLRTWNLMVNPPFYLYVFRCTGSRVAISCSEFQLKGLEKDFSTSVVVFVSLSCSFKQQLFFTFGSSLFFFFFQGYS